MFWSHEDQDAAESIGRYVREELRLRLRVAADFATLGAYELLESDEAPVERAAPEATPKAAPKRVLLFAKVAPVCPHSAVRAEPQCASSAAGGAAGRRRRGGSVLAPEQPCVDAGARMSV
jgi:hypothetical protein